MKLHMAQTIVQRKKNKYECWTLVNGLGRCFIVMLLLGFVFLFMAITISRNLRERIDGKNKND